jgi:Icc-related predicted phosphoesterase
MKIAAMSDLHGFQPIVPRGADLVIIAGDICPDAIRGMPASRYPELQASWFDATVRSWVQTFKAPTLVTWGNHDFCGPFCRPTSRNLRVVVDAAVTVAGLRIWMTPWSNTFMKWAWMRSAAELARHYEAIPKEIDVLVSHQPPYGCGDRYPNLETGEYEHIGSRELADAIRRVRPQVVICGHLHAGYGVWNVDDVPVYNVSVVNDAYQLVHPVTMLAVEPRKVAAKGEAPIWRSTNNPVS